MIMDINLEILSIIGKLIYKNDKIINHSQISQNSGLWKRFFKKTPKFQNSSLEF